MRDNARSEGEKNSAEQDAKADCRGKKGEFEEKGEGKAKGGSCRVSQEGTKETLILKAKAWMCHFQIFGRGARNKERTGGGEGGR